MNPGIALFTGKTCLELWYGSAPAHTFDPRYFFLNIVSRIKSGGRTINQLTESEHRGLREKNIESKENQEDGQRDTREVEGRDISV